MKTNKENDKLEGVGRDYYENGNLKFEEVYKDNKQEWIKEYDENGSLIEK